MLDGKRIIGDDEVGTQPVSGCGCNPDRGSTVSPVPMGKTHSRHRNAGHGCYYCFRIVDPLFIGWTQFVCFAKRNLWVFHMVESTDEKRGDSDQSFVPSCWEAHVGRKRRLRNMSVSRHPNYLTCSPTRCWIAGLPRYL